MKKSRGLGDTVEKVATALGIKSFVEKNFEDCGCDARKEKLNRAVPYDFNAYKRILKFKL